MSKETPPRLKEKAKIPVPAAQQPVQVQVVAVAPTPPAERKLPEHPPVSPVAGGGPKVLAPRPKEKDRLNSTPQVSTPSRSSVHSNESLSKDELILKLQEELNRVRHKNKRLTSKVKNMKQRHVSLQNDSEAEFELRINRLLKQINASPAVTSPRVSVASSSNMATYGGSQTGMPPPVRQESSDHGSPLPVPLQDASLQLGLGSESPGFSVGPPALQVSKSAPAASPGVPKMPVIKEKKVQEALAPPGRIPAAAFPAVPPTVNRIRSVSFSEDEEMQNIYQAELVVSNLRHRLNDVNQEKETLESELGSASKALVSKLGSIMKKLDNKSTRASPSKSLVAVSPVKSQKSEPELDVTQQQTKTKSLSMASTKSAPAPSAVLDDEKVTVSPDDLIKDIKHGVEVVLDERTQFLQEVKAVHDQNTKLGDVLSKLKAENSALRHKIQRTTEAAMLLKLEKAHLEANYEMASEASFNQARRHHAGRDRANSVSSCSDSLSECGSLSMVSTNPPSPSSQSVRERKAFLKESSRVLGSNHGAPFGGELDLHVGSLAVSTVEWSSADSNSRRQSGGTDGMQTIPETQAAPGSTPPPAASAQPEPEEEEPAPEPDLPADPNGPKVLKPKKKKNFLVAAIHRRRAAGKNKASRRQAAPTPPASHLAVQSTQPLQSHSGQSDSYDDTADAVTSTCGSLLKGVGGRKTPPRKGSGGSGAVPKSKAVPPASPSPKSLAFSPVGNAV